MNERQTEEFMARVRRIETRVTQVAIGLGVHTGAQKPEFTPNNVGGGRIQLPSPHSSVKELLDSLPLDSLGPVEVYVGNDKFGTFRRC